MIHDNHVIAGLKNTVFALSHYPFFDILRERIYYVKSPDAAAKKHHQSLCNVWHLALWHSRGSCCLASITLCHSHKSCIWMKREAGLGEYFQHNVSDNWKASCCSVILSNSLWLSDINALSYGLFSKMRQHSAVNKQKKVGLLSWEEENDMYWLEYIDDYLVPMVHVACLSDAVGDSSEFLKCGACQRVKVVFVSRPMQTSRLWNTARRFMSHVARKNDNGGNTLNQQVLDEYMVPGQYLRYFKTTRRKKRSLEVYVHCLVLRSKVSDP